MSSLKRESQLSGKITKWWNHQGFSILYIIILQLIPLSYLPKNILSTSPQKYLEISAELRHGCSKNNNMTALTKVILCHMAYELVAQDSLNMHSMSFN